MKDFFEVQETARRRTRWLVGIFFAAIAVNVVSVALIAAPVFRLFTGEWWNPRALGAVAGITAVLVAISIFNHRRRLARGGHVIARKLGGRLIGASTNDGDERTLLNIVEEMSIASGCPVPPVYSLDRELGINAFAAGNDIDDAVIAVTRGAMAHLDRDELQGIIAHEFSHILNGDMKLNQQLVAVLAGVGLIPDLGYKLLDPFGLEDLDTEKTFKAIAANPEGGGGALILLLVMLASAIAGCALVVVGSLGLVVGRWIKSAISYQREFHADAAAVQFTRNPVGLSEALQKIGGNPRGSRLRVAAAETVSHMMFSGNRASGGSATHPPLPDRIRKIDGNWNGKYPEVQPLTRMPSPPEARCETKTPLGELPTDPHGEGSREAAMALKRSGATADEWFRRRAPSAVRKAVAHPLGARAALCALLLDDRPEVYREQKKALLRVGPHLEQYTEDLRGAIQPLGRGLAFAIVDRALDALREMSDIEYREFLRLIHDLIAADGRVDLFELALEQWIERRLGQHYERRRPAAEQYSLSALQGDIDVLLSAMVHVGGGSQGSLTVAYREILNDEPRPLLPPGQCDLERIEQALHRVEFAYVNAKLRIVRALATVVEQDGLVTVGELCLLRAIAEGIGAPAPPLVGVIPEGGGSPAPAPDRLMRLTPVMLGAFAGEPGVAQLGYAEQLLTALPDELRGAVRNPLGACAVTMALLLSDDEAKRGAQLAELDDALRAETERVAPRVAEIGRVGALPLSELCLPALRELSRDQYDDFRARKAAAIKAGGTVGLFQLALHRSMGQHLRKHFRRKKKKKPTHYISVRAVSQPLSVLLSALAREGTDDEIAVRDAFERGLVELELVDLPNRPTLHPPHGCELAQLTEAITQLEHASEPVRRRLLAGALAVVTTDGVLTVGEGELLRVLAAALDQPLPPLVGTLAPEPDGEKSVRIHVPDEAQEVPAS